MIRSDKNTLIACGFRDEDHIVHDLDGNYTVIKYHCGGWKRPWDCKINIHPAASYKVTSDYQSGSIKLFQ